MLLQVFEKGCFAGACFASEENTFLRFGYKTKGQVKQFITFNPHEVKLSGNIVQFDF
jgi:hypothetical protein